MIKKQIFLSLNEKKKIIIYFNKFCIISKVVIPQLLIIEQEKELFSNQCTFI